MDSASFWDKAAAKYAKDPISKIADYTLTRDRIADILQPQQTVLEIGCGTGTTALELASNVHSYLATDISPKMIEIAKSKQSPETPPQLRFAVQNATHLTQSGADVIIALNLLHLLPDLEDTLRQIYAALPTGGLLIAKTSLLSEGAWFLPWIIPVMRAIGKAPYVRSLKEAELLKLMQNAGFEISETLLQADIAPRIFTVARKP